MIEKLTQLLLDVARSAPAGAVISRLFPTLQPLLPLERYHETNLVVAFRHPRPSHAVHILIVPKRPIKSFSELGEADIDVLRDVTRVTQLLVKRLGLEMRGYRLIVNGGPYQDVAQLHLHLISGPFRD